jgi:hypothetical protein
VTDRAGAVMTTEMDKLLAGLLPRVLLWSAAGAVALALFAFSLSNSIGLAAALGSSLALVSFLFHTGLVRLWLHPEQKRAKRVLAWFSWCLKWPAMATLLWWAVCRLQLDPMWICLGVTTVPAAIIVVGLTAAFRHHLSRNLGVAP